MFKYVVLSYADGAMPCRIAFERGKERHFWFVAISKGISGWILLAEELPLKRNHGIVRVAAPLAGCNVCKLCLAHSVSYCIFHWNNLLAQVKFY